MRTTRCAGSSTTSTTPARRSSPQPQPARWSGSTGLDQLTLTTFADVPWNRPYYERLNFHVLADEEIPDGLRRIRLQEKARGLDAWPRVCMSRPVRHG